MEPEIIGYYCLCEELPGVLNNRGAGEFFVRMIILSLSINNKKAKDVIMDRCYAVEIISC